VVVVVFFWRFSDQFAKASSKEERQDLVQRKYELNIFSSFHLISCNVAHQQFPWFIGPLAPNLPQFPRVLRPLQVQAPLTMTTQQADTEKTQRTRTVQL